jgi:F-type H+-transporting ATPase subunit a
VHSPVEQFAIKVLFALNLFGFDIQFTNSSLFMVLAVLVSSAFLYFAMAPAATVPGRMQGLFPVRFYPVCICSILEPAWPYPL